MSSWGKYDNAANAPYWATMTVPTVNAAIAAAPTAANVALLYANTTANAYVTGQTVGLFSVSPHEVQVAEVNPNEAKVSHVGWVLKTTGQGGRAGRVQTEVLVALSETLGPADGDGEIWANTYITLTNPTSGTVTSNTSNANSITFSTTATQTGNTYGGVLYQWQYNNASGSVGWTNVANSSPANTSYTGGTSATLSVYPKTTTANGYVFRVVATAAQDASVTATSANATITIL